MAFKDSSVLLAKSKAKNLTSKCLATMEMALMVMAPMKDSSLR